MTYIHSKMTSETTYVIYCITYVLTFFFYDEKIKKYYYYNYNYKSKFK